MAEDLKTGDLVLCKVGTFPPWPAVVFPQKFLRNDVYRKRKANTIAVCFFNDPTYYWENPLKLKRLNSAIIDKFLEKHGSTASPDLVGAYEEASEYDSLHDFVVQRCSNEKRSNILDGVSEVEAGGDPFQGRDKEEKGKSSRKGSNTRVATPTPITRPKKERSENEERIDGSTSPPKKKQKLDPSRRVEICLLFRRKLQKNLVQRDVPPSAEEIKESHKLLNRIYDNRKNVPPFFDVEALRQSKLHKLFKVIINDENLAEFHDVCKVILKEWSELILQLKKDKLKKENN